jgi:hypothetical protein
MSVCVYWAARDFVAVFATCHPYSSCLSSTLVHMFFTEDRIHPYLKWCLAGWRGTGMIPVIEPEHDNMI